MAAKNYSRHCDYVDEDWRCPGCRRDLLEIVRWQSTQNWGRRIVEHHDHLQPHGKPRFENVLICEDCNLVDSKLKTILRQSLWPANRLRLTADEITKRRVALSLDFSLSPLEIRSVISARPHRRHAIRQTEAMTLVLRLAEKFAPP